MSRSVPGYIIDVRVPDDVTVGSDAGIDTPTRLAQLHLRLEMSALMETQILLLFLQRRGCVQPHPGSHDHFVVSCICNGHVGALKKKEENNKT